MTKLDERGALHAKLQEVLALPMALLSVGFLVVLCWPVLDPHLDPETRSALAAADYGIWATFGIEYAALLATAPDRWRFVRTHVPDLLIVLLPMLRPLRVLRSARLLRVVRVGWLASAVAQSARRSKGRFVSQAAAFATATGLAVMLCASVMILDVERNAAHSNIRTFGDALWWSASTMTTIGEGDRYPTTASGKFISVVLMFASLCFAGVLTACVAAWFVNLTRPSPETGEDATHKQLAQLTATIEEMSAQLASLSAVSRVSTQPSVAAHRSSQSGSEL